MARRPTCLTFLPDQHKPLLREWLFLHPRFSFICGFCGACLYLSQNRLFSSKRHNRLIIRQYNPFSSFLTPSSSHHRQGRDTLHRISRLPRSHGALQTPHGPHRPRRSRPSLRNAACTPASAHRSTARKSPVLPAGRTGREASEASTAARSAADSLKWLSP